MSYSDFNFNLLTEQFGVTVEIQSNLFAEIEPRIVSQQLKGILADNISFAVAVGTEKARSEFIVAPVLAELRKQAEKPLSLFSGVEFNVDPQRGLVGRFDFLLSRSEVQTVVHAPIVVMVEAKQDDFHKGLAQCAAEMIAARIFNERKENDVPEIYGAVTNGSIWQFAVLRGSLVKASSEEYSIGNVEKIFGVLWWMTQQN